jgi:hypothetical protein
MSSKPIKAKEGEHGSLHDEQRCVVLSRCRWRLEIVDRAPKGEANNDDKHEPARFDQRAKYVHPHRFADAAEHDAGQDQEETKREQGDRQAVSSEQIGEIGGEHARLRSDRGQPRAHQREADDEAQERKPVGALGDIGCPGRTRIARAERGI